jgi:hypothetical protein
MTDTADVSSSEICMLSQKAIGTLRFSIIVLFFVPGRNLISNDARVAFLWYGLSTNKNVDFGYISERKKTEKN